MKYRFVDKIVSLDPGKLIHCQRTWPDDLDIFEDHFPGFHVVPGVLLTEMMGQSVGLCLESKYPQYGAAMLVQIKNATFREWVRPDMLLDIKAEVLSVTSKFARTKIVTEFENTMIASAELLLSFVDKEKLNLPAVDPVLAEYLDRI